MCDTKVDVKRLKQGWGQGAEEEKTRQDKQRRMRRKALRKSDTGQASQKIKKSTRV